MAKQTYIRHKDFEVPDNGVAYFGPFNPDEIEDRLNDYVGDMFASSGSLMAVDLDDEVAAEFTINPREFWMTELENMTKGK